MNLHKHIYTVFFMLLALTVSAQQGINYKALIKDGGGNVVANQSITLQFQILQGVGMTNIYQETHTPSTDANGIVMVNIGQGSVDLGVYSTIDWGSDNHFLNVQINTGSGLNDMGTTQFMAVPYALSAANAASKIDDLSDGKSDNDGTENGSSLFLGVDAGLNDDSTDNKNVGIGFNAFSNNTSGYYNTALGYRTFTNNTTGYWNTAIGSLALLDNTTGYSNTANGAFTLFNNTTGNNNTANGYNALSSKTTGSRNTANGSLTLFYNIVGNDNVAVGYRSGYNNVGSANVFLGHESGFNESSSNKLYIENSNADADNALVYGEFDTDILRTNSEFQIGNPTGTGYAFPTTDGSNGEVLQSDGNGALTWTTPNLPSGLEALDEGNGIGWRLLGQNPANFGNIGNGAVDLSINDVASTTHGATGSFSNAMGVNTTASNYASIAMGDSTTASGSSSIATGQNTTASQANSTAMGYNSIASGFNSTAMGAYTTASSLNSTAIGYYNIGGGNPISEIATDPLFEIGNGTNFTPANALTVLKNGQTGIGTANPSARLDIKSNSGEDPLSIYINNSKALYMESDGKLLVGAVSSPTAKIQLNANVGEDAFRVQIDGSTKFFIHANGGIANTYTTPTFALNLQNSTTDLLGRGRAYSWNTYSDRRIKSNIRNINYGLQTIMQLRPTAYNHHNTLIDEKSGASRLSSESVPDIGLIAQEVYELVPESVSKPTSDEDLWSMDYSRLVPVLIKALQEQQDLIDNQNNKINTLTTELEALKSLDNRVKQLEALLNNSQQ